MLKHGETANADLYCEQLDRVNESLNEKCPAIVNNTIKQDRTAQNKLCNELMNWGERYCLTHLLVRHCTIEFSFTSIATTLSMEQKNLKMYIISKMPSSDILVKNQLTFIYPALKICILDDKRLLLMKVITSLIKNNSKF